MDLIRRYYGLPFGDPFYRGLGKGRCRTAALTRTERAKLRANNDILRPLWMAGGVIYPSIYMNGGMDPAAQTAFVHGLVAEAVRGAQAATTSRTATSMLLSESVVETSSTPDVLAFAWM